MSSGERQDVTDNMFHGDQIDPNKAFAQAFELSGNPSDDPHLKNLIERGIINPQDPAAATQNFQKVLDDGQAVLSQKDLQEFIQPNGQGGIVGDMRNDFQSNQVEGED